MNSEIDCDAVERTLLSQDRNHRSDSWSEAGITPARETGGTTMHDESRSFDRQQPLELIPDFLYESRHEFVERLAYKLWVQRGRPLGSPDVDWFAAEKAVYASLAASGMITSSSNNPQNIEDALYRPPQNS
jgi:hypothetical protein